MAYGINYFFSHPAESAKRIVVRFFNFWQLERTTVAGMRSGLLGEFSTAITLLVAVIICGSYALVVMTALGGAVIHPPNWRPHLLLLLWMVIPCAIHTAAFAHSRYHLPLIPILAVYSAIFFASAANGSLRIRNSKGVAAAILAIGLILGWAREIIWVDLSQFF